MSKIILKNTSIVINDYELGDCPKLERYFSTFDPITFTQSFKAMDYDELNRKLYLPRGIDLFILRKLFDEEPIRDFDSDPFERTSPIRVKYLPRDDVQKETVRFILGIEGYFDNAKRSQLSVNLNTGKGKTYVTIASIAYWSARSIIIASTVGWLEQWENCFCEYTDIHYNEILTISGSADIHKILNGITDPMKYKAFLITHSTIHSFGVKYGWDRISELFIKLKVVMKVYDEAHLNFDNIASIDFHTNTKKTLYLTATPARSNSEENFIYKLYFKNIPSIDMFDPDNDPHTRYTALRFNSRPSPNDMRQCVNNMYGLNRNSYTGYIVQQEEFYNLLYILLDKIIKVGGKTLIYIGTNEAIFVVKDWIELNYPEFRDNVGIYTSVIPKDIKQEQLEKPLILSTTKSAGAALDIKDLRTTVVLAEPFKSEVLARQTLGRTRNEGTDYIEVVDDGFIQISKFYNAKKPIFRKYASSCKEIKLSYNTLIEEAAKLIKEREKILFNDRHGITVEDQPREVRYALVYQEGEEPKE